MNIQVKQSGGFAGVDVDLASVDTERLDPPAAAEAEHIARQFRDLAGSSPPVGADLLTYHITISGGGQDGFYEIADSGGPESARVGQLVQSLSALGGR